MAEDLQVPRVILMLKAHFAQVEQAKSEINVLNSLREVQKALTFHKRVVDEGTRAVHRIARL